jgi:RecJ-like exonuclease
MATTKLNDVMKCQECGGVDFSYVLIGAKVRVQRINKGRSVYTVFPDIRSDVTCEQVVHVCHNCRGTGTMRPIDTDKRVDGNGLKGIFDSLMG